jgi:peptidoglycan/xylan/chitin deacetylase (PgdA/CDA1 family)
VMHVSPERLRSQLEHFRDAYTVVPLRELVERWRKGRSTNRCVAITFDDAYLGVATYASPILRALSLPATVFVASDHATRGGAYWWDVVELKRVTVGESWSEATAAVGLTAIDPTDAAGIERLRNRVLARFAGRWPKGIDPGGNSMWRSLNFSELTELAKVEQIDFGVHTLSHPALPLLPYDEQIAEMRDNFNLLRERLGRVLPVVAYPYGLYDESTIRAALAAGMIAGVTMEGRASADRPNPMTVPRVGGADNRSAQSLARRLTRVLRPALVLRNRGVHPRIPSDPIDHT